MVWCLTIDRVHQLLYVKKSSNKTTLAARMEHLILTANAIMGEMEEKENRMKEPKLSGTVVNSCCTFKKIIGVLRQKTQINQSCHREAVTS